MQTLTPCWVRGCGGSVVCGWGRAPAGGRARLRPRARRCSLRTCCIYCTSLPATHPAADRHNYDPFVLEIDMKPFNANTPKITLQSHMRVARAHACTWLRAGARVPSASQACECPV